MLGNIRCRDNGPLWRRFVVAIEYFVEYGCPVVEPRPQEALGWSVACIGGLVEGRG